MAQKALIEPERMNVNDISNISKKRTLNALWLPLDLSINIINTFLDNSLSNVGINFLVLLPRHDICLFFDPTLYYSYQNVSYI